MKDKPTCLDCFHLKIVSKEGQLEGVRCEKEGFKGIQKYATKFKGSGWIKKAETCVYYDNVEFYN